MKKLAISMILVVFVAACANQKAFWAERCTSYDRVSRTGLVTSTYTKTCAPKDRVKIEAVYTQFGALNPKLENMFYVDNGMRWFDPHSATYDQNTQGLYRAVFPYETLMECRASGKC